jgi:hypothetical protein
LPVNVVYRRRQEDQPENTPAKSLDLGERYGMTVDRHD